MNTEALYEQTKKKVLDIVERHNLATSSDLLQDRDYMEYNIKELQGESDPYWRERRAQMKAIVKIYDIVDDFLRPLGQDTKGMDAGEVIEEFTETTSLTFGTAACQEMKIQNPGIITRLRRRFS